MQVNKKIQSCKDFILYMKAKQSITKAMAKKKETLETKVKALGDA
ncbi:MAG: hypothetical protein CM15mV48_210 [uncultured marine virus]|nr:MAG: hypothetical protein CM15mV48_210 [uncultured marine virus]